jgi:hypothetical protein
MIKKLLGAFGGDGKALLFRDSRAAVPVVEALTAFLSTPEAGKPTTDPETLSKRQLNNLTSKSAEYFAKDSIAMITLGSLNMIGAAALFPAGIPAVQGMIGGLRGGLRVKVNNLPCYSAEETVLLQQVIAEIMDAPPCRPPLPPAPPGGPPPPPAALEASATDTSVAQAAAEAAAAVDVRYRGLVALGLQTFPLAEVITDASQLIRVLDWLERDRAWHRMGMLLDAYLQKLPFEIVQKYSLV